jgi:O-antigen/teichoic acid export membrane protein
MAEAFEVDGMAPPTWIRSGLIGALAWGVPVLATVIATPIVIRAIGTREFGLFVAVNGIVLSLASINLARPLTVGLAGTGLGSGDGEGGTGPGAATVLAWSLVCGLGAAVLVLLAVGAGLGGLLVASDVASTSAHVLGLAVVGVVVLAVYNGATGLLPGVHRVGLGALLVAAAGCATSAGYVVAARRWGTASSMLAWLFIVLAVGTAAHVATAHHLGVRVLDRHALRFGAVRRAWPSMAPFVWAQVVGGVVNVLERVGLARVGGLDELARFAPPQLLVVAGLGALGAVVGAMVPRVARLWSDGGLDELAAWNRRTRLAFGGAAAAGGVAMVAMGPWLLDRWLDGTIQVDHLDLVPFALWLAAYAVMIPGIAVADSTGAPWLNVWLVAAAVVLMAAVGLPAMAAWGAAGVGVGRAALLPLILVHAHLVDRHLRPT